MKPLITISSHEFDSNIHRIRTSMRNVKNVTFKWMQIDAKRLYPKQQFGYHLGSPKRKGGTSMD